MIFPVIYNFLQSMNWVQVYIDVVDFEVNEVVDMDHNNRFAVVVDIDHLLLSVFLLT